MKHVLVLCHGNINRSPACAAVLSTFPRLVVTSAGFRDHHEPATKKMRDAMLSAGYVGLTLHWSQLVTKEMVVKADVVVVMSPGQEQRLRDRYPDLSPNIVLLGTYAEPSRKCIPDPAFMRRDSEEFKQVVSLIVDASQRLGRSLCDS